MRQTGLTEDGGFLLMVSGFELYGAIEGHEAIALTRPTHASVTSIPPMPILREDVLGKGCFVTLNFRAAQKVPPEINIKY